LALPNYNQEATAVPMTKTNIGYLAYQ